MEKGKLRRVPLWTKKLVLEEIKRLRFEGKSLKYREGAMYLHQAATKCFGSFENALKKLGLNYQMLGMKRRVPFSWTAEKVIKEIKKRHRKKQPLYVSHFFETKEASGLVDAGRIYFGSWKKAIEASGLNYKKIRKYGSVKEWAEELTNEEVEELKERIEKIYTSKKEK
jgi:hypothetical protein